MSFMRKKRDTKSEVTDVTIEDSNGKVVPEPTEAATKAPSPKSKKKQFAGQHEGETVNLVFHQHPIVMRKALIAGLICLTIGEIPLAISNFSGKVASGFAWWSLLVGFIVMLLVLLYRWIGWYFSIFIISSERLIQIKQKGFFNRSVTDISHNKIQSVNYEVKGMVATMFHFGTIIVQTYVGELVLRYIHKPEDVQQLLVSNIRSVKPVDITQIKGGAD